MTQKKDSISYYRLVSVLVFITAQSIDLSAKMNGMTFSSSSIDHTTQNLIRILRSDDLDELETFIEDNPGYNFNKLRNGLWTTEKSTALIECIVLDAYNCLNYLLFKSEFLKKDKITKTGLMRKSSDGFYPLDYALHPKVKTNILDFLIPYYESYNLKTENYVSEQFKDIFETYKSS
jgi:hypothetical protein